MTHIQPIAPPETAPEHRNGRQMRKLEEVSDLGLKVARAVQHLLERRAAGDKPDPEEERTVRDIAAIFVRTARELRQAVALEARLDTIDHAGARVSLRKQQVKAAVEHIVKAEVDPVDADRMCAACDLRIADFEDAEILESTLEDLIARVCHHLRLFQRQPDLSQLQARPP